MTGTKVGLFQSIGFHFTLEDQYIVLSPGASFRIRPRKGRGGVTFDLQAKG